MQPQSSVPLLLYHESHYINIFLCLTDGNGMQQEATMGKPEHPQTHPQAW
jgi:hypothetical protein